MQIPSTDVAEILGAVGYDWIAVDLEHGAFSNEKLSDVFRAINLYETIPMARVAQCHPKDIKRALDSGARGIILPMIESRKQLEKCISWANYPPGGTRGIGYSRANLFGSRFESYMTKIADDLVIVAQIEHWNAVNAIDEILSVHGLDAIMVGPYDLSGSMGIAGQFDHPDFIRVMDEIVKKAKESNIPMGTHIVQPDTQLLNDRINAGYQFIAYGIDAVFLQNAAQNFRYEA